jgi:hypothetical protein
MLRAVRDMANGLAWLAALRILQPLSAYTCRLAHCGKSAAFRGTADIKLHVVVTAARDQSRPMPRCSPSGELRD